MKKVVCLVLVLAFLLPFALTGCKKGTPENSPSEPPSSTPDAEQPTTEPVELKLSIDLPENTDLAIACQKMADNIAERTNGRYKIKLYCGGTLCSQAQLFSMLSSGGVDMGESPIEYQSDADIRFTAVQLPFSFKDIQANYKFNKLINERLFNKILAEKFNVMPLVTFSTSMHQYCGTKQAVKTLEDWKGKLVWTGNPTAAATATALGASPVNLEFWDGYPALQKGTVDAGISIIPFGVLSFQWYDAIRNISICNITGSSSNIYISLDVFNKMPEDVQQIFLEEGKKLEEEMHALYTGYETSVLEDLEELGVNIRKYL